MQENYDLIIIGAGPGGYTAAIRAAQYGLSTALIEQSQVGGTCLNRGCIPTKTLMKTSHLYGEIKKSMGFGISVDQVSYQMEEVYNRKNEVVKQLRMGIESLLSANKIDVITGLGSITGKNTVTVSTAEGNQKLHAAKILIATGSVPALPPVEGITLAGVVTSNEMLDQSGTDYKSLVIIGGGVIGVEFASIFNSFGCQVTIIEAMDRLLPTVDLEISRNLTMIMKKRGVSVFASSVVEKIEESADGLVCHWIQKGKPQSIQAEAVLVATGRKANMEGLFPGSLTADFDRGLIVNGDFETSIPGIYAIGDVVQGGIQLAHVASAQACNVIDKICKKEPMINLQTIPSCIYTDPEIAVAGIDEAAAKAKNIAIKIGKYSMAGNGKSFIEDQDRGFIKLIFEKDTEVLLGAQLMCARATDLISELSTAIVNHLTRSQIAAVIRPHPTFTEGITEAVEEAEGMAIHIAPRIKVGRSSK